MVSPTFICAAFFCLSADLCTNPIQTRFFADLVQVLDDLEVYAQTRMTKTPAALNAVRDCRSSLEKLISKMDTLETGFDRIAERSRGSLALVR